MNEETRGVVLDLNDGRIHYGDPKPGSLEGEVLPNGDIALLGRVYRFCKTIEELKRVFPKQDIILDCGAGRGEFAADCLKAFPEAIVHSFEPVSSLYAVLSEEALKNERHKAHQLGILDASGTRDIYLTKASESNSFLPFLPGNPLAEQHEVVGTERVVCVGLDEWCLANGIDAERVTLLKLDLQGAELFAFRGATELLKHVRSIYCEVSFVPIYDGCPTSEAIDAHLEIAGFKRGILFGTCNPAVWANVLYVRSEDISKVDDQPLRLNIGGGENHIDGFVNVDRKIGSEAYPLAYADESVQEIRASHILEHFSFREAIMALKDWVRVLKTGCRIRIAVPDFDRIIGLSRIDPKWHFYLMGGQTDENDFHKSVWTIDALKSVMRESGLSNIACWEGDQGDCSQHPCSLNLEGLKNGHPKIIKQQELRICAVMSIPRVGWNDNWGHTMEALAPFRIPIRRFNGVYWGQCMQRAFNECMADGIDWILTIDYDTLFTAKHLDRLMGHLGSRPDIDAIAALQARRGSKFPLMTIGHKTECEVTGDPVRVTTAHFGLTLIRMDCLKEIAKPWFYTKPDENSEYGDNRLDDDIWFWHQWRLAGKTIYIATDVSIGHLEAMVAEFDIQTGEHRHVYIQDWRERQLPETVRKVKCLSDSKLNGGNGAAEVPPNSMAGSPTS